LEKETYYFSSQKDYYPIDQSLF